MTGSSFTEPPPCICPSTTLRAFRAVSQLHCQSGSPHSMMQRAVTRDAISSVSICRPRFMGHAASTGRHVCGVVCSCPRYVTGFSGDGLAARSPRLRPPGCRPASRVALWHARRWIDGYDRGGVHYPPVVRAECTRDEEVTWGEFVETRLLAEFRARGASMRRLRPAVVRLREEFGRYPLAHARPFLDIDGRELVRHVQQEMASRVTGCSWWSAARKR